MKPFLVAPARSVKGRLTFPGDKSIAHRAAILSALSTSRTLISNFPANQDCLSTLNAFRKLGIKIIFRVEKTNPGSGTVVIFGKGLSGLSKPPAPIYIGDSGTTFACC
jgi:5-enolpyruvylshikimate-3-phosphate synthase